MSSARIDFEGQYGGIDCCAPQPFKISKTKPAILDGRMTNLEWMSFCERIDAALHPLNKLRRFAGYATIVLVMAFIAVPVAVAIRSINNFNSPYGSSNSPNIAAFIIGPLVAMCGLVSIHCFIAKKSNSVMEDLQTICDGVSKQLPRLSFHVRFERHYYHRSSDNTSSHTTNYIEVIVAGDSAVVPYATAVEPVIPYPTAPEMEYPSFAGNVSSDKKSPAERLATLEAMKPYLSDKEYSTKRAEILDNV
uniref:Uncharacterized protein n=2 Tax=Pseudictyota dubia TaxID=2749911 RepID=A0A7R9ZEL0_9STRA|mmetsp:Transcript_43170/g.80161  ORF Transcript_43170/g.80161 Transcript_43170/m.80161 type:complete len:249 (+) Transcript_43170:329-1075(+)